MLTQAALPVLNHMLESEAWASRRLANFAGQTVRVTLSGVAVPLKITERGLFAAADPQASATVSLALPADTLTRILTDRASLFAAAQIGGSAELAECLGFVFRNLSWDAEADLARWVGDIAARRLVTGGKRLFQWQRQLAENLAVNLSEYFTEEARSIVARPEFSAFGAEVDGVSESLGRLEDRIATLERKSG